MTQEHQWTRVSAFYTYEHKIFNHKCLRCGAEVSIKMAGTEQVPLTHILLDEEYARERVRNSPLTQLSRPENNTKTSGVGAGLEVTELAVESSENETSVVE